MIPPVVRVVCLFICAISLPSATSHAQGGFTDGLVAYLPLDGSALDHSGYGNHGVMYSVEPTADRYGNEDSALRFAGTSGSHITLTNFAAFVFMGDFTISVWINFAANTGTEGPRIFSTAGYEVGTQGTGIQRALFINNTGLGGVAVTAGSDRIFPAATWIHVVGRRQGDRITIYGNGWKEGEATGASSDYSRGFLPEVGGNSGAGFDAFGGSIDDLRVYNRALSDAEIRTLYALEQRQRPSLAIAVRTVRISMSVTPGSTYLLQNSADMGIWAAVGSSFVADGPLIERDVDVLNGRLFFRLEEINLTNGLVAAYALNGNANDSSGKNNHGVVVAASGTTNRFGLVGHALQFDGTSSFVTIPESDAFDAPDYTVSLWFRADRWPFTEGGQEAFLLSKGRNNFELHLGSAISGATGIRFLPRPVGALEPLWDTDAGSYQTNTWHHLVAIYQPSANTVRIFRDGQPLTLAGADNVVSAPDNTTEARLGIRSDDGSNPFRGALDDLRIYNRALTEAEVRVLFHYRD